jgi:hypothetical protein
MTKQAAAILALGIAGAIITCAFTVASYEFQGLAWAIAAFITAAFTMGKLWECASAPTSPKNETPKN